MHTEIHTYTYPHTWKYTSMEALDVLCVSDMNFFRSQLDKYPSLITGESTPSYLLHS